MGGTMLDSGIDIIVVLVSVSIPNHVRNRQLPLSPSSQQPPSSHSSHPNDRLHQARKASSTALGPSSLRFHHRLRLKVRGARNTAANMPAIQEVSYQPHPRPLTSFLSRPSIPISPCPISSPPPDQTSGSPAGTPTQGLAESSIPVRHQPEDSHTRRPEAVLLWNYSTCYPTPAA